MAAKIRCRECHFGTAGREEAERRLSLPASLTTATGRDIIAAYVELKVRNKRALPRRIEEACEAVSKGQVLFFWNNQQITDLTEPLPLIGENEAVFIHLIPLQGG